MKDFYIPQHSPLKAVTYYFRDLDELPRGSQLSPYTVWPATVYDAPRIAALHNECFPSEKPCTWNSVRDYLQRNSGYVAMDGERVVGYVQMRLPAEIVSVGVEERVRRRGVGLDLIHHALRRFAILGMTKSIIAFPEERRQALGFLRAAGFESQEERWARGVETFPIVSDTMAS